MKTLSQLTLFPASLAVLAAVFVGCRSTPPAREGDNCRVAGTTLTRTDNIELRGRTNQYQVVIPGHVTRIDDMAFSECHGLTNVAIGKGVTNIGAYAFAECGELAAISVSPENRYYSSVDGVLFNKQQTELILCPRTKTGQYTPPASVTCIDAQAFYCCTSLTNIALPDGVTDIGEHAFAYCPSLTNFTFPRALTNLGEAAFVYCEGLTDVVLPASLTNVVGSAFRSCIGLTNVAFGSNVAVIGSLAFNDCSSLASVTFGSNVTVIGYQAFRGCTNLAAVALPPSLVEIGDAAFADCSRLTHVTIPDSVAYITGFNDCTNLANVTLPAGADTILGGAFRDCSHLARVIIPKRVTCVEESAFEGTGLTEVTVPDSVTNLGYRAFAHCASLVRATIGSGVARIGYGTFNNCASLTAITVHASNPWFSSIDGVLFDKNRRSLIQYPGGKPGDYTIPDSVTEIEPDAFMDARELRSVTIPASCQATAWFGCSRLTNITVRAGNTAYCDVDGVLLNEAQTKILQYPRGRVGDYAIPDRVLEFGHAFRNHPGLTRLRIPARVIPFEDDAFLDSPGLREFEVDPGNSFYCSVDGVLFEKDMTVLVACPPGKTGRYAIPDRVTRIGNYAFRDCTNLDLAAFPAGIIWFGNEAFKNCTSLTNVVVPAQVQGLEPGTFENCIRLTNLTLNARLSSIGSSAFAGCANLTGVTIPDNVSYIGAFAFLRCSNLVSVVMSTNVTSIGRCAFGDCPKLTAVYFRGDAPELDKGDAFSMFDYPDSNVTIYYRPGTTGWEPKFHGWPTAVWNPPARQNH